MTIKPCCFSTIYSYLIEWCISFYRLSDYGLEDLPADILKHLKNLKVLDLSCNKLQAFPEVTLKTLETLDISENNINSVDFVRNLPNLRQLMLAGNPLIQVRPKISRLINGSCQLNKEKLIMMIAKDSVNIDCNSKSGHPNLLSWFTKKIPHQLWNGQNFKNCCFIDLLTGNSKMEGHCPVCKQSNPMKYIHLK